jgi:hypothetical protein
VCMCARARFALAYKIMRQRLKALLCLFLSSFFMRACARACVSNWARELNRQSSTRELKRGPQIGTVRLFAIFSLHRTKRVDFPPTSRLALSPARAALRWRCGRRPTPRIFLSSDPPEPHAHAAKRSDVDYTPLHSKVRCLFARQLKADAEELEAAAREGRQPRGLSIAAKFAPSEGGQYSRSLKADKQTLR